MDHHPSFERCCGTGRRGAHRSGGLGKIGWVVAFAIWIVLPGCEKKPEFSQASPDEVIASAVKMVKTGETGRLSSLIYADSPEMRVMLDRLGRLLEHMQELSSAAQAKFPEEFAKLRVEAEEAAASGKSTTLLGTLVSQAGGRNRRGTGGPNPDQARQLINQLFADPFGWIEVNASRITTLKAGDDAAFVMLDGQPAIPIVGLPMRRDKGKWFVELPTGVPPISSFWPRSREEWSIAASMVKVIDNAVVEVTGDVNAGGVSDLSGLIDRISDKALFPAGLAFVAYGKELDVRNRVERRLAQFGKRRRDWVQERRKNGPSDSQGVSPALVEVIDQMARGRIEADIRRRKPPMFEEMSTPRFEETIRDWLKGSGLNVAFEGDLASPSVDASISAWRDRRK